MKFQRQSKILELIERQPIETQEALSDLLRGEGFEVTQATVSRDIRELRLSKSLGDDGRYRYAVVSDDQNGLSSRLRNIFRESVISVDCAGNMVVIKTPPGLASAASAALDAMRVHDVIGTLAGDDTVFLVVRSETKAVDFCIELKKMLKHQK